MTWCMMSLYGHECLMKVSWWYLKQYERYWWFWVKTQEEEEGKDSRLLGRRDPSDLRASKNTVPYTSCWCFIIILSKETCLFQKFKRSLVSTALKGQVVINFYAHLKGWKEPNYERNKAWTKDARLFQTEIDIEINKCYDQIRGKFRFILISWEHSKMSTYLYH